MTTRTSKKALLALSIVVSLFLSQSASADNWRYGRGYGDYGYNYGFNSGFGNHYYGGNRYRGSSFGVSFGRSWGYGPNRYRYGHRNYRRHGYRRFDAGDFVGGLVLGSVLNASLNPPRYRDTVVYRSPVTRTREVVYVNRPQTVTRSTSSPRAVGRSLLLDLEGNCFERVREENGDEVRVQLDPSECEF